jgi:hypothetical protein
MIREAQEVAGRGASRSLVTVAKMMGRSVATPWLISARKVSGGGGWKKLNREHKNFKEMEIQNKSSRSLREGKELIEV